MESNNNEWIKKNVKIFLDENIPPIVFYRLKEKGYNVENVLSMEIKGRNDNYILQMIREDKRILVTYDYRFYKMAIKYNKMAILIETGEGNTYKKSCISGIVIDFLIHNFKEVKYYYGIQ